MSILHCMLPITGYVLSTIKPVKPTLNFTRVLFFILHTQQWSHFQNHSNRTWRLTSHLLLCWAKTFTTLGSCLPIQLYIDLWEQRWSGFIICCKHSTPGNLALYQELLKAHNTALSAQPALVQNERKLLEKINILCLMEISFREFSWGTIQIDHLKTVQSH